MASGTLKISKNFGNPYEEVHAKLVNNPFFVESDWRNIVKGNSDIDLDMYIATLQNIDKIEDVDKFYKDYNYYYADSKTRVSALYNEIFADKTTLKNQPRYVYNDVGAIMRDEKGEPITEMYQVTDYDYYKSVIKEYNDNKYAQWLKEVEQERKDSMNGFGKFINTYLIGVPLDGVRGLAQGIDGAVSLAAAVSNGMSALFNKESFSDAFINASASSDYRPFDEMNNWIIDFENRYTNMRDLDGNYTNLAGYLGRISYTIGQMVPAMLITKGFGAAAAGTTGAAAAGAATLGSITSQVVYYGSMTSNNIRDMYQEFAFKGVSVPSAQILTNAALKSVFEISIEKILGAILGGSALDNLLYGSKVGKSSSNTLLKSSLQRILKDAGQESLEEVLQEVSGFLVDDAFTRITKNNFGELKDLTWQALFDAAIIAFFVSTSGSAVNVIRSSGKGFEGNAITKKLRSYEYGINLQSFMENYNTIIEADKKAKEKSTNNSKEIKTASAALTQMYASYRVIASLYSEIGEARVKAANDILTKITSDIKQGKYESGAMTKAAKDLHASIFDEDRSMATEYSEAIIAKEKAKALEELKALEEAKLGELAVNAVRGEDISTDVDAETSKEINEVFSLDKDINNVAVTNDGEKPVKINDTLVTPKNLLVNGGAKVVLSALSEEEIVEAISTNKYGFIKLSLDDVVATYKKLKGVDNINTTDAVRDLLFDPNLEVYKTLLITANKDMYHFLEGLAALMNKIRVKSAKEAIDKNKINIIFNNMRSALVEYLKVQIHANYNLDILTKAQIDDIIKARQIQQVYYNVITGKTLSDTDKNILENRIKYLNVNTELKTKILNNIYSDKVDERENAIKAIDHIYTKTFYYKYDGVYYMPLTSIPNIAFNMYLQSIGLNLTNFLSQNSLTEADITFITDSYDQVNEQSILAYRLEQFRNRVDNKYYFEVVKGKVNINETATDERVGYSNYSARIDSILVGDDIFIDNKKVDRHILDKENKLNSLVKKLINSDVPAVTANMLSITDIIQDSTLLDKNIIKNILTDYGAVTSETAFMYLRKYVLNLTKTTSITVLPDGEFAFVNVAPMEDALKVKHISITDNTKLGDLFKSKYIYGRMADTKIVLTNAVPAAEYHSTKLTRVGDAKYSVLDNTIYINRNLAKEGGQLLKFALLHEFQHVLQYENGFNLGMDESLFNKCSVDTKHKIIEDLRKHVPQLFIGNPSSDIIEKRVADYIYHTSAESMSMGLDASVLVDFYPTVVKEIDGGLRITFPWGSSYDLLPVIKMYGITIQTTALNNPLNKRLDGVTENYTIDKFAEHPKNLFIMPSGELRTFEQNEHIDVINLIDPTIDQSYWDSIPQIVADGEFFAINIKPHMTNAALQSLLQIMDILYDKNVEFSISTSYYNDFPSDAVMLFNTDADSSDELLDLYSKEVLKSKIQGNTINTELGPYIPKQSLAKSKKSIDTEVVTKDDTQFYSKTDHKYISRTVRRDANGEIVYRTNQNGTRVPVYDYVYPYENRYVSHRKVKDTPLENFTDGERNQMSTELQNFINSTKDNKIAKVLQDKIDGVNKGTLTTSDVKDYLRDTPLSEIDETTFKLINKAFFHNDIITTPKKLQYYIDNTGPYFAAAILMKTSNNTEALTVQDATISQNLVDNIKKVSTDSNAGKLYTQLLKRFYYGGNADVDNVLDISEKYLKTLWLSKFDGSLETARKIANAARYAAKNNWTVTGEVKANDSLERSIGDDITLGDSIEDKSALQDLMDLVLNSDRNNKISALKFTLSKKMFNLIAEKYGTTKESASKALQAKRIIDELTPDQLNEVSIKALLSDILGLNFDTLDTPKIDEAISKIDRPIKAYRDAFRYHTNKIKKNLTPKQIPLFLKQNSDIFNDDLTLKESVFKTENSKGEWVNKDSSELEEVWARLRDLSDDVIEGAYSSKSKLTASIKAKRTMAELNKELVKELKKPVTKPDDIKIIQVGEDIVQISTKWSRTHFNQDGEKTSAIPAVFEKLLDIEFNKLVKSKTKYLTNDTDYHFQHNVNKFLEDNAEVLESMTQQDVDDLIEFFINSEILPSGLTENKFRLYNAVQLYTSIYLLKGNKLGWFVLSQEQTDALKKRTELTVSVAAQELADWKASMKMLEPERIIIKSLARSTGIEFNPEDVQDLAEAVKSGDIKRITAAKNKAYRNAAKKYEGRKRNFWDKLFEFERVAMLSSPGTWVRNATSNILVGGIWIKGKQVTWGLLDTADALGQRASKLIDKVFPEKWKKGRENQYKIYGTKVSTETTKFIETELVNSGLLKELLEGLNSNKYDIRKSKGRTSIENLTDMICSGITSKIFHSNIKNPKLDKVYQFIYKALSDDKAVTRNMLRYLGKMLTENKTDITKGITDEISTMIADAYILAADDFMHKPNVWNNIDRLLKNKLGSEAYFAYKQIFPFAATSWNWFIEGLRYSPIGLVKSIYNFAKLENTVATLDDQRSKGNQVINSRFAEYIARRNIGKGVIGTIGAGIAALLAIFGVAKLDSEDDKYKLMVGDVSLDISEIFGTQGIYQGLAVFGPIVEWFRADEENRSIDFSDICIKILNTMFVDSVFTDIWNTMRYNDSLGDYIASMPMQIINNMVPNLIKTTSDIVSPYKIKYNKGFVGQMEKLFTSAIPGLAYAMPHYIDIYTGEKQIMYKANFITEIVNKLTPFKIAPMNVSNMEKLAIELNVNKTMLSGKYTIGNKTIKLTAQDIEELNQYYGLLNKKSLSDLTSNRQKIRVKTEKGDYIVINYSKMTKEQRGAAIEQVMSKNSTYAKIYILTSKGYKYYASDSEYETLKKLGITKNVYRKTSSKEGFIEP